MALKPTVVAAKISRSEAPGASGPRKARQR
jgi:hypothetical protein